jgi:phosphate transport system permease protein
MVVLGGLIIIGSILAILGVIWAELWPLFRPPSAQPVVGGQLPAGSAPMGDGLGVDEYRSLAYSIGAGGDVRFAALGDFAAPATVAVPGLDGARLSTVASAGRAHHVAGTTDGRVVPIEVKFPVEFNDGRYVVTAEPVFGQPRVVDPERRRPILRLASAREEESPLTVAQLGPADLVLHSVVEKKALIGGSRREESLQPLARAVDAEISALALDGRGDDLFIGTAGGQLVRYDVRDPGSPARAETVTVSDEGARITVLGFLNGDRTLIVGDERGAVSTWQVVPAPAGGPPRLTRVHRFARHPAAVVAVAVSRRDKGFATADATGGIHVSYGTSGETLLRLATGTSLTALAVAPKADGVMALDSGGTIHQWYLHNPHPEATLKTLFGKVWYEGYTQPTWVWQSTGGTDDFEAKFSLTPLIYGTLKGTFYALLFAVPLALLAALYVSEFMRPTLKGYLKPVVEIMAALPSVVLGFLAGLWLAPTVERVVPALFLLPALLAAAILAALLVWRLLPRSVRNRLRPGGEVFLLLPVVVLAGVAAFGLGGLVEARLLGGDYRGWLLAALGLTYDQRNSLVVGVAMGFAVIPIIFTIAEDSLANVPQHLRAGSLALGATRWQTAVRIVLPTASPGIFSAIMIGFGRAVGETMIVLMATGNTPVMDWSIFSGFRALSANIAVELPEAPDGGTLFRVLFLAAFLLFCLTFVVNTVAELVRIRLRRKYRYL